ncbi:unnamed protein product [Rotaria sordida]|uniref:Calponin-homology (CH) domain-containing protein n=1 Tax=Rotaria sordida TaxID=392033 RepID=A0A818IJ61_9BILA|nr:unnamed protein product [Rotaria sordida]CAF0959727.1 unnamed protein product [Rotaria sordida]CAF1037569.1 unnamed protein product [Rotaria sordida]CAF1243769.1 unnamed protein product [Rotaria sordida]CAF3520732.1 unnamed protein product [Rotaria sordida]
MYNQSPNGYSGGGGGGPGYIENPQYNEQGELIEEDEFGRTEEEFDEDMQRELADDAPWKRIQQNTFTRWANEHLKLVNRHCDDLQSEFSDGLNLIALIEVLSQKRVPKYNRRPNFRSQKLENVSVILDFLENTERIRLVNIDATHIVDGKLKLILGLIWTLILHYSISLPMWEFEQPDAPGLGRDATPKQKLMNWIQEKLPPELPITNFTSDWNDGRAIGALVDACAPGLYPDWNKRDPRNALENAKEAMDAAERYLGIPQLIQPHEMVNPKVDEQSMMTYLSQYPSAKLKPGAPIKPKTNSARVRCYGKGIEPSGNQVDAPAKFHVETFAAGEGNVEVIVINPKGQREKCDIEFRNDKNQTYDCTYYPTMEGQYKVIVKYGGQEVPKSPFSPYIEGKAGDAGQCRAYGPGIEPTGVMVDKPTWFEIDATNAGNGLAEVIVVNPRGRQDAVPVSVKQTGPGKFRCEYVPREPGLHSVNVFFAGRPIPNSPYGVNVASSSDAKKCRAFGRGIQPRGVRTGDVADFRVITKDAGEGAMKATVTGPDGNDLPCRVTKANNTTYECGYVPNQVGPHTVNITYGGQHIPRSPFPVAVGPYKDSRIRAYGPGLEGGVVGYPADFVVETNGETGSLGDISFSIEGPSQARIECKDNGDGSANVRYWPTVPGEYAVHILCNDEDIPLSPYMAWIEAPGNFDPNKVKAYGPGLEPSGQIIGKPTDFTIDTNNAGEAPLRVQAIDQEYQPVDVQVRNNGNGTYACRYTPRNPLRHSILIDYGGVAIPNSPFRVWPTEPSNPSKVRVYGPGVERGVKMNNPTYFIVDCKEAGPGDISIALTDPKNQDVPFTIDDNQDGTFRIAYTAKMPGVHCISVLFGDSEIPTSPIKVNVEPSVDISKIRVEGLDTMPIVGQPAQVTLNTLAAGPLPPNAVHAKITGPTGNTQEAVVAPAPQGYHLRFNVPEPGPYVIEPDVCTLPLRPVQVTAIEPLDPNKVRAYGPGLSQGTVNKPADFIVDTRGAGNGQLGITVEGPSESKIDYQDNNDGSCRVTYHPTVAGNYNINILYEGKHIPGSPFRAAVRADLDTRGIRCYGPGLDPKGVFLESPTEFTVDAKSVTGSGAGRVESLLTSPSGRIVRCPVKNMADGTYQVQYAPYEPGIHQIEVTYENIPVPGSPFRVNAIPGCDPMRVRAYGPGLEQATTNEPTTFTIETKGAGQGSLGLAIEGPSEAKMVCKDNQDGTCIMEYLPTKAGLYDIAIKFAEQHIPGSPFRVPVRDRLDAGRVNVKMSPVMRANVLQEILIDGQAAGPGTPFVDITDVHDRHKPASIRPRGDGVYVAEFTPQIEGPHRIDINWSDQPVRHSPFNVQVLPHFEPHKVIVDGPGIHNGIPASLETYFRIDTREAGFEHPDVLIKNPEGQLVQSKIVDNKDGTYKVTYKPNDVGRYLINVNYGGVPINNSPYNVKVEPIGDPTKCHISGTGTNPNLQVGEEYTITVDTHEAGPGAVTCRIRSTLGNDLDIDIVDNEDGTFNLFYTPHNPGNYVIKIKFGGQDIPGGDFVVTAGDGDKYYRDTQITETITSRHTPSQYRPVDFRLPVGGGQFGDISALIRTPSGRIHTPILDDNQDGTVSIKYQPSEVGLHELDVFYQGQPIAGSPFKFHVDQVQTGYVTAYGPGLSHGVCNEACSFRIVTKDAGSGGLSVAVEGSSKAEIQCKDNKDGTCDVTYWPTAPGEYTITVKFADKHIVGSPFTAKITGGVPPIDQYKRSQVLVGNQNEFSLRVTEMDIHDLRATIRSPSGFEEPCILKKLANGSLGISFIPREIGDHLVNVYRDGQHIKNSPFRIHVGSTEIGDASKVRVYGRGLQEGYAHQTNEFTVVTRDAGYGGLSLSIEGPSKADIECHDNEDGSCLVTYKPTEPGIYIINVKFADKHVPGSPFTVNVGGQGSGRLKESIIRERRAVDITHIGSQCELSLKIPGIGNIPQSTSGGEHRSSYQAYSMSQVNNEKPIVHREHEEQSQTWGQPLSSSPTFYPSNIDSDRNYSYANRLNSSSSSVFDRNNALLSDSLAARQKLNASSAYSKMSSTSRQAQTGAQHFHNVPYFHGFKFQTLPGTSPFDMSAYVTSPSGHLESCEIVDLDDCNYSIKFIPKEMGVHTVSVKHKDMHIPGSPFEFTVGPIQGGGAHKVRASGNGLARGEVNITNEFNIYTREAGAGGLAIAIEGPAKAEIDFFDRKDGSCGVSYICPEPGEYQVSIKFNDEHIPDSPFNVLIGSPFGDVKRLTVQSLQGKGHAVNQPCMFTVNVNGARGRLDARVTAPSGAEDTCIVQEMGDEHYAIRFIPRENGVHWVHVRFNGRDIPDSPFRVVVGHANADPGRVFASGSGLYQGETGASCEFLIDTMNAGAGALAVTVDGPSKVQLDCREVSEGYRVSFTPTAPGDYLITIKFAGINIAGSPFKCLVGGMNLNASRGGLGSMSTSSSYVQRSQGNLASHSKYDTVEQSSSYASGRSNYASIDATRVRAHGEGLLRAYRNEKAIFTVDTRDGGNGMLMVGVFGPKCPCEEVFIKHVGNNQYNVQYTVRERGEYMLVVKWGDQHIPGSPWHIEVV